MRRHADTLLGQLSPHLLFTRLVLLRDAEEVNDYRLAANYDANCSNKLFERRSNEFDLSIEATCEIHEATYQVLLHEVSDTADVTVLDHRVEEVQERADLMPELVGLSAY